VRRKRRGSITRRRLIQQRTKAVDQQNAPADRRGCGARNARNRKKPMKKAANQPNQAESEDWHRRFIDLDFKNRIRMRIKAGLERAILIGHGGVLPCVQRRRVHFRTSCRHGIGRFCERRGRHHAGIRDQHGKPAHHQYAEDETQTGTFFRRMQLA
jgi:hypothetical protein